MAVARAFPGASVVLEHDDDAAVIASLAHLRSLGLI